MATKGIKRKVQAAVEAPPQAESSSEEYDSDSEGASGNAAWADSIAKVLNTNKPKTKKSIVLSKAKKLAPRPKDSSDAITFEIDGEVKEEKPDKAELDLQVKKLKNQQLTLRVKPTAQDFERERALRKIATRGVVQLFNAVRLQQKELQQKLKEAGPLDSKRDAVLCNIDKKKFLDVLMSGKRAKSEVIDNPVKKEEPSDDDEDDDDEEDDDDDDEAASSGKKGWSVLRDDYMTNKKVKSWDEESEDEGEEESSDEEDDE